jgi:hypothetical protein
MSKWMKRTCAVLAALAVCGVATVIVGKQVGERKLQRVVKVAVTNRDATCMPRAAAPTAMAPTAPARK